MRVANGELDAETAADVEVLTRKAGLTPWHARALAALERIANYYDTLPPIKTRKSDNA